MFKKRKTNKNLQGGGLQRHLTAAPQTAIGILDLTLDKEKLNVILISGH